MRIDVTERNAIIIANDINLSIFLPWWLIKNEILSEEEIINAGVIVSPVAIEIPTLNFSLTILPNRIQMSIKQDCPNALTHMERVLGKIVTKLPHTPYSAFGFNLHNNIIWDNIKKYEEWNSRLFSCPFSEFFKMDDNSHPRFGAYVSFNIFHGRLNLRITLACSPKFEQSGVRG